MIQAFLTSSYVQKVSAYYNFERKWNEQNAFLKILCT